MTIFEEIENFCNRVDSSITQKTRRDKIKIYASGLKSKIRQSNFALSNLGLLATKNDHTMSTTVNLELDYYNQVAFYCDTFCVFLYSSLDILAQIINQLISVTNDERQVDFIRVKNYLSTNNPGGALDIRFLRIFNSRAFINLNRYRNCSLHRRQIYLKEKLELVRHTEGYVVSSTQDNLQEVIRIICDNPYDINPKIKQERQIPEYLEKTKIYILNEIKQIIRNLP